MTEMKYTTISGKELSPHELDLLKQKHVKPKAAKKDQPKVFHKGFRVVGHRQGACEDAYQHNLADWKLWQKTGSKGKSPKLWNEASWRMNTKKKAVRHKPYEVYAAALACKELAIKEGWENVDIVEISRGTAPEPLLV